MIISTSFTTYREEYEQCQEAFIKLMEENKKLRAEIERKDGHIKYALRVDDHSMVPMNKMVRRRIEAALSNEEANNE